MAQTLLADNAFLACFTPMYSFISCLNNLKTRQNREHASFTCCLSCSCRSVKMVIDGSFQDSFIDKRIELVSIPSWCVFLRYVWE